LVSTRKAGGRIEEDDEDDYEEEEGLDEREPEKAICPERCLQLGGGFIEEFKHQILQIQQE
jgi:hypothetical protein